MLEALSYIADNIRDSDLVVLRNGTTPHDSFPVDLRSAATMNNVIASGVLFHNYTMPHDRFRILVLHNCTMHHDSFPVDLGSAASMNNIIASGVLFHNCTMPHDCYLVDPIMSANNVMTTEHNGVEECISELRLDR